MEMNSYQDAARKTAAYPDVGRNPIYPTLGLTGEAGEVAEHLDRVVHGGVLEAANVQLVPIRCSAPESRQKGA